MKVKTKYLSAILITAITVNIAPAQPGIWAPPVNISNTFYGSFDPDMAIGPDGHIHVVWPDYSRLGSFDWRDILYAVYDGYEWSEPVQVSAYDTTYSHTCYIAIDSTGRPHVVWNHRAIFIDGDVYYATLSDSGWTEPLNLTPLGLTQYAPDICIDSRGFIHVVWADYLTGNGDIYHQYYDGVEWSDYVNITNEYFDFGEPCMEVDSEDNLHLTCRQYSTPSISSEIVYFRYDGVSWSQKVNISNIDSLTSSDPDIALDTNDNPHVVWRQTLGGYYTEIYYSYFDGNEWTEPEDITNLGLRCDYPRLAINSQDVKCMLFSVSSQQGDQYVNYTFGLNYHWTYPDTVFDDYICCHSTIAIDDNDVLHACIILPFNTYGDIGYTYFRQFNEVSDIINENPSTYSSINNYPNPFNSETKLTFALPEAGEVSLIIYDIQGREVARLVDGFRLSGVHEAIFNGSQLSSGIYFARLQADGFSHTRKLLLIK